MASRVFVPRQEIGEALNFVANSDLKGIGYAALVYEGENTGSSLGKAVAEHTGIVACKALICAYPPTFLIGGFATSRIGVGGHGRNARFYKVLREEVALPVDGTLLEWADLYKRSLISVLSSTPSRGQGRGPLNTVQIFDGLLKGLNIHDMQLPGYKPGVHGSDTSNNSRLDSLVNSGLVKEDDPNEFKILDPTYRGTKAFDKLRPEAQVAYQVLGIAKEIDPKASWTIPQLIGLGERLLLINERGKRPLAAILVSAISSGTPKDFPGAVEKRKILPKVYALTDSFEAEASDLVERLYKVNEDNRRLSKEAADYAINSYLDPQRAARILKRGIKNSPYIKNKNLI